MVLSDFLRAHQIFNAGILCADGRKCVMSKSKIEIPKISLSSTKKEMIEAFNEVKEKLEEKADAELNPEKKKEEKRIQEVVAAADTLSSQKVVSDINTLKIEIAKMLSSISEKLDTEVDNYQKIMEAIRIKNNELKETYEIEKSAFTLVSLIEANNHKKLAFEIEMNESKEKLEEEMFETRLKWDKEKKDHIEQVKELHVEENKKRSREKEEYIYNFEREKQLAQNTFKDEMAKLESDLILQKEQFEKNIAEKELQLKEREDVIQKHEKEFEQLRKDAQEFQGKLDFAVNKAIEKTTARLKDEAKKQEMLLTKGYEGEKNVLLAKIESLEKAVSEQAKQIITLSQQLEKAYGKVQDIAIKAVDGSANIKAFNNLRQYSDIVGTKSQE